MKSTGLYHVAKWEQRVLVRALRVYDLIPPPSGLTMFAHHPTLSAFFVPRTVLRGGNQDEQGGEQEAVAAL